jgi:hypothetical protein
MAGGLFETAQGFVRRALDTVTVFDVPLASWRVHRTAWDALGATSAPDADTHRAYAERGVRALADSLIGVDPLRQAFLSAPPVRRVLEAELNGNLNETFTPPLVQPS